MNISFGDKQLWISLFAMLLLIITFAVLSMFVSDVKGINDVVLEKTEMNIMESRLIYSPNCFAYKDSQTGRTYSGWIDSTKFSQAVLQGCTDYRSGVSPVLSVEIDYVTSLGNEISETVNTLSFDQKKNLGKVVTNSYPIHVAGFGPGVITFTHWI